MCVVFVGNVHRAAVVVSVCQVIEWMQFCLIGFLHWINILQGYNSISVIIVLGADGSGEAKKAKKAPSLLGFILCRL